MWYLKENEMFNLVSVIAIRIIEDSDGWHVIAVYEKDYVYLFSTRDKQEAETEYKSIQDNMHSNRLMFGPHKRGIENE